MRCSSSLFSTRARKEQKTWPRMVSSSLWKIGRARLELIEAAEGGDHPLTDLAGDPPALGDLEIDPPARDLLAEVHARLHVARTQSRQRRRNQMKSTPYVALHFGLEPARTLENLRLSSRLDGSKC